MKKITILLIFAMIIVLAGFSLPACSTKNGSDKSDTRQDLTMHLATKFPAQHSEIIFKAHYLRGFFSSVPANRNNTLVISSTRELEQFYQINRRQTDNSNLIWNESFFAENFLVLVNLIESSGSIGHRVEKIDESGKIYINRLVPEIGTADMASRTIVIELNRNHRAEQYEAVITTVAVTK